MHDGMYVLKVLFGWMWDFWNVINGYVMPFGGLTLGQLIIGFVGLKYVIEFARIIIYGKTAPYLDTDNYSYTYNRFNSKINGLKFNKPNKKYRRGRRRGR